MRWTYLDEGLRNRQEVTVKGFTANDLLEANSTGSFHTSGCEIVTSKEMCLPCRDLQLRDLRHRSATEVEKLTPKWKWKERNLHDPTQSVGGRTPFTK
jgi:hypothetical protein